MIIKNYEIKKFLDNNRIFLIHGENEGLKEDIILDITSKYSKESITKYTEKDVQASFDNFYNTILSQSFFENNKIILINDVSDKFKMKLK